MKTTKTLDYLKNWKQATAIVLETNLQTFFVVLLHTSNFLAKPGTQHSNLALNLIQTDVATLQNTNRPDKT